MTTAILTSFPSAPAINTTPPRPNAADHDSQWLVASPYLDHSHSLDLNTLEPQARLFALALSQLQLATPDYAVVRYEDVFDFDALMCELRSLAHQAGVEWKRQDFYVVEFRSKLKHEYDGERLAYLDKESHREAVASGGLLKYWFGVPNVNQQNLATCMCDIPPMYGKSLTEPGFWRSKEDAIKGGRGPQHRIAKGIIMTTYKHIDIKGLRLTIDDDVARWWFELNV